MSSTFCLLIEGLKFADFDILKPDGIQVVLEQDRACPIAKAFMLFILTFLETLLPIIAAVFDFDDFFAIEPVLDVITLGQDAALIPFADRLQWFAVGCGG